MIASRSVPKLRIDPASRAGQAVLPTPTPPRSTGSWRYDGRPRSRGILYGAALFSAALHAAAIFGLGHPAKKPAVPPVDDTLTLTFVLPQLKELEEPEMDIISDEDAVAVDDVGLTVPLQADVPQLPQPTDFVQQIDFASLVEQPEMSQTKVFVIPENIRRGGKLSDKIGTIFNLSDLDRQPVPIFQPAPVVPPALKTHGAHAVVRVEYIVTPDGQVVHAMVRESTDYRFDEAAIRGVSKWKFRPGIKGGRRVNVRMAVPIIFRVGDGD